MNTCIEVKIVITSMEIDTYIEVNRDVYIKQFSKNLLLCWNEKQKIKSLLWK